MSGEVALVSKHMDNDMEKYVERKIVEIYLIAIFSLISSWMFYNVLELIIATPVVSSRIRPVPEVSRVF